VSILQRIRPLAAVALLAIVGSAQVCSDAQAQTWNDSRSPEMSAIRVEERLGDSIDRSLGFIDHTGTKVTLGDYLDGKRPVLLTLNYFRCRTLCNLQLGALTDALARLEWTAGDEHFRIVTVGIDPRESFEDAAEKRTSLLGKLGRGDHVDWSLLTGDAFSLRGLAAQLGVGYAYDKEQDQYAHPAVVMFLSPDGKIARYVYGLSYEPRDLEFGLIEAGEGRVGSPVEQLILSCFHYDATIGRYAPVAFNVLRWGGGITVVALGTALLVFWRRERRSTRRHAEAVT